MRLILLILLVGVTYDAIRFDGGHTKFVWQQAAAMIGPLAEQATGGGGQRP